MGQPQTTPASPSQLQPAIQQDPDPDPDPDTAPPTSSPTSPPTSSPTSPPTSSTTSPPTSSPPAPLSRRPPFCHLNYKHLHCEDCGRCAYLCGEHHGCYCVSDNAIFCDVCYCEYGVRYTNPKDKL